jgi:3-oxoacyl-[acyl-carrier protein] reductase
VAIHYSSSAGPAQDVVAKLTSLGVKSVAIQANASGTDFGTKIVEETLKALGNSTVDIIVNNAGTAAIHQGIANVPVDAWDEIYNINVRAAFLLIQAALPHMREGGRIINVGSVITRLGHEWLAVYGASKGALDAMTVAVAQELGPKGITINVVAPGPIATELSMKGSPIFDKLMNNAHIKREGDPREVAEFIRFLAQPGSGYVTGQILSVDGGIRVA